MTNVSMCASTLFLHSAQDQKEEVLVQVDFLWTDDPCFYDFADRRLPRATLFEEIQWEDETENGSTDLNFGNWLQAKRDALDVAMLPPWEEIRFQLEQAP